MMKLELEFTNPKDGTYDGNLTIEKVISFFINDEGNYFVKYIDSDIQLVVNAEYGKDVIYKFFIS